MVMMKDIIKIEGLQKSYGKVCAVKDLSFCVKEGELFAFLGLNGAGKSTTISILCGQLEKDGGRVEINGKNLDKSPDEIKREIGVVFQNSALDKSLSVYDNLKTRAALYAIEGEAFEGRLQQLASSFELTDILHRPTGKLSGGQRRKVDVVRALLHEPKILILDEPTTGLDPQTRKRVWEIVDRLRKQEKMTVFLTTHYMEEAVDADYIVILDSGEIVAKGTPLQLKNAYTKDYILLYNVTEDEVKSLGKPYDKMANGYRITVENALQVTQLIVENSAIFRDYEVIKGKMDDVFLAATGKHLVGGNV